MLLTSNLLNDSNNNRRFNRELLLNEIRLYRVFFQFNTKDFLNVSSIIKIALCIVVFSGLFTDDAPLVP